MKVLNVKTPEANVAYSKVPKEQFTVMNEGIQEVPGTNEKEESRVSVGNTEIESSGGMVASIDIPAIKEDKVSKEEKTSHCESHEEAKGIELKLEEGSNNFVADKQDVASKIEVEGQSTGVELVTETSNESGMVTSDSDTKTESQNEGSSYDIKTERAPNFESQPVSTITVDSCVSESTGIEPFIVSAPEVTIELKQAEGNTEIESSGGMVASIDIPAIKEDKVSKEEKTSHCESHEEAKGIELKLEEGSNNFVADKQDVASKIEVERKYTGVELASETSNETGMVASGSDTKSESQNEASSNDIKIERAPNFESQPVNTVIIDAGVSESTGIELSIDTAPVTTIKLESQQDGTSINTSTENKESLMTEGSLNVVSDAAESAGVEETETEPQPDGSSINKSKEIQTEASKTETEESLNAAPSVGESLMGVPTNENIAAPKVKIELKSSPDGNSIKNSTNKLDEKQPEESLNEVPSGGESAGVESGNVPPDGTKEIEDSNTSSEKEADTAMSKSQPEESCNFYPCTDESAGVEAQKSKVGMEDSKEATGTESNEETSSIELTSVKQDETSYFDVQSEDRTVSAKNPLRDNEAKDSDTSMESCSSTSKAVMTETKQKDSPITIMSQEASKPANKSEDSDVQSASLSVTMYDSTSKTETIEMQNSIEKTYIKEVTEASDGNVEVASETPDESKINLIPGHCESQSETVDDSRENIKDSGLSDDPVDQPETAIGREQTIAKATDTDIQQNVENIITTNVDQTSEQVIPSDKIEGQPSEDQPSATLKTGNENEMKATDEVIGLETKEKLEIEPQIEPPLLTKSIVPDIFEEKPKEILVESEQTVTDKIEVADASQDGSTNTSETATSKTTQEQLEDQTKISSESNQYTMECSKSISDSVTESGQESTTSNQSVETAPTLQVGEQSGTSISDQSNTMQTSDSILQKEEQNKNIETGTNLQNEPSGQVGSSVGSKNMVPSEIKVTDATKQTQHIDPKCHTEKKELESGIILGEEKDHEGKISKSDNDKPTVTKCEEMEAEETKTEVTTLEVAFTSTTEKEYDGFVILENPFSQQGDTNEDNQPLVVGQIPNQCDLTKDATKITDQIETEHIYENPFKSTCAEGDKKESVSPAEDISGDSFIDIAQPSGNTGFFLTEASEESSHSDPVMAECHDSPAEVQKTGGTDNKSTGKDEIPKPVIETISGVSLDPLDPLTFILTSKSEDKVEDPQIPKDEVQPEEEPKHPPYISLTEEIIKCEQLSSEINAQHEEHNVCIFNPSQSATEYSMTARDELQQDLQARETQETETDNKHPESTSTVQETSNSEENTTVPVSENLTDPAAANSEQRPQSPEPHILEKPRTDLPGEQEDKGLIRLSGMSLSHF